MDLLGNRRFTSGSQSVGDWSRCPGSKALREKRKGESEKRGPLEWSKRVEYRIYKNLGE